MTTSPLTMADPLSRWVKEKTPQPPLAMDEGAITKEQEAGMRGLVLVEGSSSLPVVEAAPRVTSALPTAQNRARAATLRWAINIVILIVMSFRGLQVPPILLLLQNNNSRREKILSFFWDDGFLEKVGVLYVR